MAAVLQSQSEAHALVSVVEHGVVLAQEDIAHDPQRASRNVDASHAKETHGLSHLRHLDNIFWAVQDEGGASEGDVEIRKAADLGATSTLDKHAQ